MSHLTARKSFSVKIITAMILAGLLAVSPLMPQKASAEAEYQFNNAENKLMQRYKYIRLRGVSERFVVDTQSREGWSFVYPGDVTFNGYTNEVLKTYPGSQAAKEAAKARFAQAWENATAAEMPKLIERCPKSNPLKSEGDYPTPNYGLILLRRYKKNLDGSYVYRVNKNGQKVQDLAVAGYLPVIVENDDLKIIDEYPKEKNQHGDYVYTCKRTVPCEDLFTPAFRAYKDATDKEASRRAYNKHYLKNPPRDYLVLLDDVKGILLYQALPDGTLVSPKEWLPLREAEVQPIKELQAIPLENFDAIEHEKTGRYALFMDILDNNGKKIDSLGIFPGREPIELKKAIQIIQGKAPFGRQSKAEGLTQFAAAERLQKDLPQHKKR